MPHPPPGGPGSARPHARHPQPMQAPLPAGPPFPNQRHYPPPPTRHPTPSGSGAGRKIAGGLLGLVGALALLGGGALTAHAYSNHQQKLPNLTYGEDMWRDEPVDKVFPKSLGGRTGYNGGLYDPEQAIWNRVGISPDTECDKGLTGYTLEAAQDNACKAVLRATYVDTTGNMVATVALVVLPEGRPDDGPKEQVRKVFQDNRDIDGAIAPYAVPGTLAAEWHSRNGAYLREAPGQSLPYAIGASIGSVDGHTAGQLPDEWGDLGGQDVDRESWHANAEDLVGLFVGHLPRLRDGDLR